MSPVGSGEGGGDTAGAAPRGKSTDDSLPVDLLPQVREGEV
jgi:hypothetical protein